MTSIDLDQHIDTAEAAKQMGVSVATVSTYCWNGELPARKCGRSWLIAQKDVTYYIRFRLGKRGRPRTEKNPKKS